MLGFHGAATLSDLPILTPHLIRTDCDGGWFGLERAEPRISGCIARLTEVALSGQKVTLANIHFDSHGDPQSRGYALRRMLTMIEALSQDGPVVLGGDFNTSAREFPQSDPKASAALLAANPAQIGRAHV